MFFTNTYQMFFQLERWSNWTGVDPNTSAMSSLKTWKGTFRKCSTPFVVLSKNDVIFANRYAVMMLWICWSWWLQVTFGIKCPGLRRSKRGCASKTHVGQSWTEQTGLGHSLSIQPQILCPPRGHQDDPRLKVYKLKICGSSVVSYVFFFFFDLFLSWISCF